MLATRGVSDLDPEGEGETVVPKSTTLGVGTRVRGAVGGLGVFSGRFWELMSMIELRSGWC